MWGVNPYLSLPSVVRPCFQIYPFELVQGFSVCSDLIRHIPSYLDPVSRLNILTFVQKIANVDKKRERLFNKVVELGRLEKQLLY